MLQLFSLEDNDFGNNGVYEFKLGTQYAYGGYPFDAKNNYWGTTDTLFIDEKIYDFFDDHKLERVNYIPILEFPLEKRYPELAIDRSAPTISVPAQLNNTYRNHANVSITWSGDDAGSGINGYAIKLDDDQQINVGMILNYTFENLPEDMHVILILAFDKIGNVAEATVNVCIDLTPPMISDVFGVDNSEIKVSTFNFSWSGLDNLSGIDHYEIKLNNDEWLNLGMQTNYTFTYLPDGTHTIIVRAYDKAQNLNEINLQITVNTSYLFGPGWSDDAIFVGGLSIAITVMIYYFFIKEKKVNFSQTYTLQYVKSCFNNCLFQEV